MEDCDCGWCGRCAQQLEYERYVQNLRGYGIPSWEDEYPTDGLQEGTDERED